MSQVKAKIQIRNGRAVQVKAYSDSRTKRDRPHATVNKPSEPEQLAFFGDLKPTMKKQDPRAAVTHERSFPSGEEHLALAEIHRAKLVRQAKDAPLEGEAKEARKKLETLYLKTWQPMILGIARDSVRSLGLEARRDDSGRPMGLFADFAQEANVIALAVLRGHDPAVNKTHVRDLVRGSIKARLFERWRSIIGAHGSVQDNADLSKMAKIRGAHLAQHGEEPTDVQIAAAMNKPLDRIQELKEHAHRAVMEYLDAKTGPSDDAPTLGAMVASTQREPAEEVHGAHVQAALSEALDAVKDPRARLAIALEHGLADKVEKYGREVAEKYGVSYEAVTDFSGEKLRDGAIRNVLAQRLGLSRSAGGKMVQAALEAMKKHPALQAVMAKGDAGLAGAWGSLWDALNDAFIKAIVREVPATFEEVQTWRMDAGVLRAYGDPIPMLDLVKAHERLPEEEALLDLLAIKEPHVELLARELAADPEARVAIVVDSPEARLVAERIERRIGGDAKWEDREPLSEGLRVATRGRGDALAKAIATTEALGEKRAQVEALKPAAIGAPEADRKIDELLKAIDDMAEAVAGSHGAHADALAILLEDPPAAAGTVIVVSPEQLNDGFTHVIDLEGGVTPPAGELHRVAVVAPQAVYPLMTVEQ